MPGLPRTDIPTDASGIGAISRFPVSLPGPRNSRSDLTPTFNQIMLPWSRNDLKAPAHLYFNIHLEKSFQFYNTKQ